MHSSEGIVGTVPRSASAVCRRYSCMELYAEISARQQRPSHPVMAQPIISPPKMKFPLAPQTSASDGTTPPITDTTVPVFNRSSQEALNSPLSSPQRVNTANSTGSSPTKTVSSTSSYEVPTTFTQFHPSNKPTAPLYRPAVLRSADHPAPPQPFLRRNSFSIKEVPSVKRDHWKVFLPPNFLIETR